MRVKSSYLPVFESFLQYSSLMSDEKILVSACLVGINCRYDCKSKSNSKIIDLLDRGIAVPVCPEQLGGLPTPREPAERVGDKVLTGKGKDVTENFIRGAEEALKLAKLVGAKKAILKSKSPMCGKGLIYDGTHTGNLTKGDGFATELFLRNNIEVESCD